MVEESSVPGRTVRGVSIVVGVIALLIGLYVVGKREQRYRAEATVAIAPVAKAPTGPAVEALANGDVVASFAQVFSGTEVVRPALTDAGIPGPDRDATTITAEPVQGAAVVKIEATAPSREIAEKAATAVATHVPKLDGMDAIYATHPLRLAAGTATKTGTSTTVLRGEALIVAVVIGLLTAAAVRRIPVGQPPPAAVNGSSAPS
jgi:hypothetical protein